MTEFDRITLEYINSIDSIEVDYSDTITNIELTVGQNVQTVYSVNNLYGDVVLSASAILSNNTMDNGYYIHVFEHNLNTESVLISTYDPFSNQVIADVVIIDSNNVRINALIDLTGYKAVAQR
jgi:hypothetical protein